MAAAPIQVLSMTVILRADPAQRAAVIAQIRNGTIAPVEVPPGVVMRQAIEWNTGSTANDQILIEYQKV